MYNVYGNAYRELGSFSWARDPTQSKLHPPSNLPVQYQQPQQKLKC